MVGRCTRLTVCSLVLCFGGSAGAQERGKTLYAAQCERCHKSPQDVTTFHGGVGLETFLGELHYADTPESAATIAAYLKGLAQARPDEAAKKRPTHSRRTKQRGQANPFPPAPSQPVPNNADPNDDPVKRALKRLFGGESVDEPTILKDHCPGSFLCRGDCGSRRRVRPSPRRHA